MRICLSKISVFALDLGVCVPIAYLCTLCQPNSIFFSPISEIVEVIQSLVLGQKHTNYASQQSESQTHWN